MDAYDKAKIQGYLSPKIRKDIHLEIYEQLESTNSYLLSKTLNSNYSVCISEIQTKGRGRHGKDWHSPAYANIYMSLAHKTNTPINELSGFSLVVGICVAETLQKYADKTIETKWPNDLLAEGKKLCGILIELQTLKNKSTKVVTGIGINIGMGKNENQHITQPFINLMDCTEHRDLSRNTLIANLITALVESIDEFSRYGFKSFHDRWNALDAWYNKSVYLDLKQSKVVGIHKGVDLNGALLLEVDGKLSRWTSGEISLRRTQS